MPPLRILVIGKSGCGKSSLIERVCGKSAEQVVSSSGRRAPADVKTELPTDDGQFIFHEGPGFESGAAFHDSITTFVDQNLSDDKKPHAIWLCIETCELSDMCRSKFQSDHENVMPFLHGVSPHAPVICVWTKFEIMHKIMMRVRTLTFDNDQWSRQDPYTMAEDIMKEVLRPSHSLHRLPRVTFDSECGNQCYNQKVQELRDLTHAQVFDAFVATQKALETALGKALQKALETALGKALQKDLEKALEKILEKDVKKDC